MAVTIVTPDPGDKRSDEQWLREEDAKWRERQASLPRADVVEPADPQQRHLVDVMVAASGMERSEVIARWFASESFRPTFHCGFGERLAERRRNEAREN